MPFNGDYDGSIVGLLEQMRLTADLEGVAVLDLSDDVLDRPIAYRLGTADAETIEFGQALLTACSGRPTNAIAPSKRAVLACPWVLPPNRPGGVLLLRGPESDPWTDADHDLAAAMIMLLRCAIGANIGYPGIDRLTSLPNRRWFLDEGDRHIDRLTLDDSVGTLVLVHCDNLHTAGPAGGRELGDRVLVRMSSHLRGMVRPGDIVARVGPDELAFWAGGMDHLTAAERADALCSRRWFHDSPHGHQVTVSVGIASRPPGCVEDIRTLLRRAHMAAREVKIKGGGGWRVSHPQPMSRYSGSSA